MGKYDVGTVHKNKEGEEFKIIEYINCDKRIIKFLDNIGYECEIYVSQTHTGNIKNHGIPSVHGVGFLGFGHYKVKKDGKFTKEYETWRRVIRRSVDEKTKERYQQYADVNICEEWHNFQNFAEWYDNNYPKHIEGIKFQLDKDLFQSGIDDKIYSPKTAIFLPEKINKFLTNKHKNNTSGDIGVTIRGDKYVSQITDFDTSKNKYLGYFKTPEEASQAYQIARAENAEKAKQYLRDLNYLPEEIIQLIK